MVRFDIGAYKSDTDSIRLLAFERRSSSGTFTSHARTQPPNEEAQGRVSPALRYIAFSKLGDVPLSHI